MGTAASSSDHQRVKKVTSSFKLPWQKREDNPLMALNEAIEASDDKKVKAVMKSRKKSPFDLTALDSDGLTPLNKAVKLGDERVVDAIVSSSSLAPDEVNIRDKFGYTPLHWAVRGTNDAILNKLLEVKSIRVDVQNNDQNTPLHYFCEKNHSPDCERIGKMLIDKGALVNKTNNNGETPLHKAIFNTQVRLMMVRLLINNHADVNLLTQQRQSPLQYAVRLQREDLVTMLLKAGARLDLRSSDGLTAHEVAVKERCDKIAALLAECEKLQHWLAALDFERFFPVFVREEILFEQLPDLREDVLTKLGITTAGQRMKLMKAVQELRTERALHTMAAKERAAQLDQPPSFASNAANAEGEWLQQLTAGMDLREGEHIAFTDIELLEELGSGAAGKVYKGLYKGKHVAVKVLKELKDGAELEDFKKELEIMTSIRSPYMIFFYGVVLSHRSCASPRARSCSSHTAARAPSSTSTSCAARSSPRRASSLAPATCVSRAPPARARSTTASSSACASRSRTAARSTARPTTSCSRPTAAGCAPTASSPAFTASPSRRRCRSPTCASPSSSAPSASRLARTCSRCATPPRATRRWRLRAFSASATPTARSTSRTVRFPCAKRSTVTRSWPMRRTLTAARAQFAPTACLSCSFTRAWSKRCARFPAS
jgi:ankyrin repeat protein